MKKLALVLAGLMLFLSGCSKTVECSASKMFAGVLAKRVAERWSCDESKMHDLFVDPVDKLVCRSTVTRNSNGTMIMCTAILAYLEQFGADQIAHSYSCDKAKVMADLSQAKLCEMFLPQATPSPSPSP